MYQTIVTETKGKTGTITLSREERRNAISPTMIIELFDALRKYHDDRNISVIVLTGAGGKAFCAGADFSEAMGATASLLERHEEQRKFAELFKVIKGLQKPLLGRINGHALGGGFGLACSCDIMVAAEDCQFGTPEINVGLFPSVIMTTLLRSTSAPKRLLEMMLTGERVDAREAQQLGLVNHVVIALSAILIVQPKVGTGAQSGYEPIPVLSASRILPPELLSGPNHRVQERVRSDGIVNIYRIDSPFGSFEAVSTAMLRIRIHEINAMAVMDKLKGTKEYAESLKESGLSALSAAKDMVFQPIKTTKEVASGVGLMFRRAGDSLFGAKRSDAEDSRFKTLIGFTNYKRDYAAQLGLWGAFRARRLGRQRGRMAS